MLKDLFRLSCHLLWVRMWNMVHNSSFKLWIARKIVGNNSVDQGDQISVHLFLLFLWWKDLGQFQILNFSLWSFIWQTAVWLDSVSNHKSMVPMQWFILKTLCLVTSLYGNINIVWYNPGICFKKECKVKDFYNIYILKAFFYQLR